MPIRVPASSDASSTRHPRPSHPWTPATFATTQATAIMSTEELIRITVFANRNAKLSEDEFNDHWANKHGPLITSWLQRHGIIKYVQVSFPISSPYLCSHSLS